MMIDDEQVGLLRLFSGFYQVAVMPVVTFTTETIFDGRSDHRPNHGIFRYAVEFGYITSVSDVGPFADIV